MAAPAGVLWEAEPHTLVKHQVYERYLRRWLPIMVHGFKTGITYAEGFAGPGRYAGGEPGSPIIALRTLIDDKELRTRARDLRFLFVEKESSRVERLRAELALASHPVPLADLPRHGIDLEAVQGECDPTLIRLLTSHRAWGRPMLVVLDSWGGAVNLDIVRRIAHNPSSEVIITFQPQYFVRFAEDESIVHGDTVFGNAQWRDVSELPSEKKAAWVVAQYRRTLLGAGFRFVLTFELIDADGKSLFLVFGTSRDKGLIKMKEAMWEVDAVGGVRYRDPADPNQGLLDIQPEPDLQPLIRTLAAYLEGRPGRAATVRELRSYALYNTVYKESQVKPALDRAAERGRLQPDSADGAVRLTGQVRLLDQGAARR